MAVDVEWRWRLFSRDAGGVGLVFVRSMLPVRVLVGGLVTDNTRLRLTAVDDGSEGRKGEDKTAQHSMLSLPSTVPPDLASNVMRGRYLYIPAEKGLLLALQRWQQWLKPPHP